MRRLISLRDAAMVRIQLASARATAALLSKTTGQGLVEYGLILVLIAVVVVGIMTVLGQTISTVWYQRIVEKLNAIIP